MRRAVDPRAEMRPDRAGVAKEDMGAIISAVEVCVQGKQGLAVEAK